jgi:hypothetical protein
MPGTPFTKQPAILSWARAGLEFWSRIQRRNGTFNEWYPNEGSFVATAFSAYAASEAILQLDPSQRADLAGAITAVARAGNWLARQRERRALNQAAGAAAALYNAYALTGEGVFASASRTLLEHLRQSQNAEGWFPEYGGADMGYLSLTVAYLAKLLRRSGWEEVEEILEHAVGFLSRFIQSDDSAGGEHGSRTTEYMIPDGFEVLGARLPAAAAICAAVRRSLARGHGIGPGALDDRYLTYIGYNYLQAYQFAAEEPWRGDATPPDASIYFPQSGLARLVQPGYDLVVNLHRGGAFKAVFEGQRVVQDGGVVVRLRDGSRLYSGFWQPSDARVTSQRAETVGSFVRVTEGPLDPPLFVAFHAFQLSLGHSDRLNWWVKQALRDRMITPKGDSTYRFARQFEVGPERLLVKDRISCEGRASVVHIILNARTSMLYVPSSKYFSMGDMDQEPLIVSHAELALGGGGHREITLQRVFDPRGRLIEFCTGYTG